MLELVEKYFQAFETKNFAVLEELYDDEIVLSEPVIATSWSGKKAVLEENQRVFNILTEMKIKVLRQAVTGNTVFNEIELFNGVTNIPIIDIITFKGEKIVEITAFVGEG